MARRVLSDPRVAVVVERLVALYLHVGSVNGLSDLLSSKGKTRKRDKILPNRIHTLLSGEFGRAVNDKTLEVIEKALMAMGGIPPDVADADGAARRRGHILAHPSRSEPPTRSAAATVAEALEMPLGVVLTVLGGIGSTSETALEATGTGGTRGKATTAAPDWSFQDTAYRRTRAALARGIGRKVGLVIPTGGGKTRVALRIILGELVDSKDTDSVVIWVTHRKRLALQARRELQRMVTSGTPELPLDAVVVLAHRVRFVLTTELDEALARTKNLSIIVVDEAHHAAAPSYQGIFQAKPAVRGLFLTATPNRRDERHIGIDEIGFSITYRELFARGVLIEPSFETAVLSAHSWSDEDALDDFADRLLERAEDDFVKTLVVATTVEKVLALHEALQRVLMTREGHILDIGDIGWVHGSGSSSAASPDKHLDEFELQARGILIATAGLLAEGFDDRSVNAVVITYPSSSLVQLMQAAGRCLRYSERKVATFVMQVKESEVAYHFEQRWLYREISDLLRPQLVDVEYGNRTELRALVGSLLGERRVKEEVRNTVLEKVDALGDGEPCALLLTGLPYGEQVEEFAHRGEWNAILDAGSASALFREVFNEFCERGAESKELEAFLTNYMPVNQGLGSDWRVFMNMLLAMEYARREIRNEPYDGRDRRPFEERRGTTWLTYISFHHHPLIPKGLSDFLADSVNRERIVSEYLEIPSRWALVVRLALPLGGALAFLLDQEQADSLGRCVDDLTAALREGTAESGFGVVASFTASINSAQLPMPVLCRLEQLLTAEGQAQHTHRLAPKTRAPENAGA